ncbi:mitochondrial import inner membrane translocase subunit TIM8-like [Nymphaea colorata]|uniref:mitochondrial import inner membrane translocase subunit TIM8-like n=1 Tax=Nymphaea colorata TaxID=210225 RepID=UPI00129ED0C5|nr:mitochondrial import inner membrane translocase subunit TIM8-like [Nymphaea colorata]
MDSSSVDSSEFQRFLEQEKGRAMVNEMVGKLTSICWDKCITGTPGSKFSSSEVSCLTNCAQSCRHEAIGIMVQTVSVMGSHGSNRKHHTLYNFK